MEAAPDHVPGFAAVDPVLHAVADFFQKGFADLSLQLVMAVPRLRDDGTVVREKVFRTIFITAV